MTTYLSKEHLSILKPSWKELISIIEKTLVILNRGDFAQPIKPYLRYRDPINRIIAMPAFVGGDMNYAGMKWIASFPENIKKQIPRAHALTILNHHESGKPLAILSSNELSGIRTAAVSGYAIQRFVDHLPSKNLKVGITGFGPIGKLHAEMVLEILKDKLKTIQIYDIQHQLNKSSNVNSAYEFVNSWQEAYKDADIFITCTTSKERYIHLSPKKGSLQLNVSLRDYCTDIVMQSSCIVVDDWNEVCRENTDIEQAFLNCNLQEMNTLPLKKLVDEEKFKNHELQNLLADGFISFHFMGMAVFDISVSSFFYEKAMQNNIGIHLPD